MPSGVGSRAHPPAARSTPAAGTPSRSPGRHARVSSARGASGADSGLAPLSSAVPGESLTLERGHRRLEPGLQRRANRVEARHEGALAIPLFGHASTCLGTVCRTLTRSLTQSLHFRAKGSEGRLDLRAQRLEFGDLPLRQSEFVSAFERRLDLPFQHRTRLDHPPSLACGR